MRQELDPRQSRPNEKKGNVFSRAKDALKGAQIPRRLDRLQPVFEGGTINSSPILPDIFAVQAPQKPNVKAAEPAAPAQPAEAPNTGKSLEVEVSGGPNDGARIGWGTRLKRRLLGTTLGGKVVRGTAALLALVGGLGILEGTGKIDITPLGKTATGTELSNKVPTSFDNSKVKIAIGDNNIKRLPEEEIRALNLAPKYDSSTKILTYRFPFKMPEGTTATLDKTPRVRAGNDPKTLGINESPLIRFSTAGVEIVAPADAKMALLSLQRTEQSEENPNSADWLMLYHYDSIQDETTVWSFTSVVGDKNGVFEPLQPLQKFDPKTFKWEEQPTVKEGTSIMATVDSNQAIDINVRVNKGKITGTPTEVKPLSQFPTDPSSQKLIAA